MATVKQKTTRPMPRDFTLEKWYTKTLMRYVRAMSKDTEKAILQAWKANEAKMAAMQSGNGLTQDASPAKSLAEVLRSLRYNWKNFFSDLSKNVAEEFARRAEKSTTGHLKNLLKEVGFGVEFKATKEVNTILQASIKNNVSLIKSIHSVYFDQVENIIMQGMTNGRDLAFITKELHERFGVTERRAAMIARDQVNKATAALARKRTLEAGIRKATWQHVGGKKMNRSSHENMEGKEFDLNEGGGLWDPAVKRNIFPGELINCNCKYRIVVPDLGQDGGVPLKDSMDGKITAINKPRTKVMKELQSKRDQVRDAVFALLRGVKEEITLNNLRNDLEQYGGTNHITLMKGNKKKGLEHIIKNGREHYLGGILDAVIEGKIDTDYNPRGGQKVRLNHGNYQAVLVLEDKTWALTGWDIRNDPNDEKASYKWKQEQKKLAKDERCEWHTAHNLRKQGIFHSASLGASTSLQATPDEGARFVRDTHLRKQDIFHSTGLGADMGLKLTSDEKSKVRTRHLPTQTEPILSRHCLGADESMKDIVRTWRKNVKYA